MKTTVTNTVTAFLAAFVAVALSLPADAQVAKPDYPLPHPLSVEALQASIESAPNATVYCLTLNLQEVDDDGAWDPFTQSIGTCDDMGRRTITEGQTHYLDQWEMNYRWVYSYGENGLRNEWLIQSPNNGVYEDSRRLVYEHEGAGNEISRIEEDCLGTWLPQERRLQTFDGDARIEVLDQLWVGGAWVDDERDTYDEQNGIALSEMWDGSQWVPVEQSLVTEDNGTLVQVNQDWDGSQWVNESRWSSSSDFRRVEMWDGSGWVGVQNQLLTYDGFGNLTELLEQYWDATGWANDYRARYIFEATGMFQTEFHLDQWDGTQWTDDHRQLSTLDENGNEIEELWQDWDDTTSMWESLIRYTRTYQAFEVSGTANERDLERFGLAMSAAYPNPASTDASIQVTVSNTSNVSVTLHDVLGRQISTVVAETLPAGNHDVRLPVSGLATGTYFVRLLSEGTVITRPLTVVSR